MKLSKTGIITWFISVIGIMFATATEIGEINPENVITYFDWLQVVIGYIIVSLLLIWLGYLEGKGE